MATITIGEDTKRRSFALLHLLAQQFGVLPTYPYSGTVLIKIESGQVTQVDVCDSIGGVPVWAADVMDVNAAVWTPPASVS